MDMDTPYREVNILNITEIRAIPWSEKEISFVKAMDMLKAAATDCSTISVTQHSSPILQITDLHNGKLESKSYAILDDFLSGAWINFMCDRDYDRAVIKKLEQHIEVLREETNHPFRTMWIRFIKGIKNE